MAHYNSSLCDGIVFAAVHLISESSDHFNILAMGETLDEIMDIIVAECHEDMEYISEIFVNCSDPKMDEPLREALRARINEDSEDLEK